MAKKSHTTPVSETKTEQTFSPMLVLAPTAAKDIEKLTKNKKDSPLLQALGKIANLRPGDAPVGQPLGANLYYLCSSRANSAMPGLVYAWNRHSETPTPAFGIAVLTYGAFAGAQMFKGQHRTLTENAQALMELYKEGEKEMAAKPKNDPKKHAVVPGMRAFVPQIGVI